MSSRVSLLQFSAAEQKEAKHTLEAGKWLQEQAIDLCAAVEGICPEFGCHVALTGGCLYKPGRRKDADLLFYRIRQVEKIDRAGLLAALGEKLGFSYGDCYGWVQKAKYMGKSLDLFFPECADDGEYNRVKEAADE